MDAGNCRGNIGGGHVSRAATHPIVADRERMGRNGIVPLVAHEKGWGDLLPHPRRGGRMARRSSPLQVDHGDRGSEARRRRKRPIPPGTGTRGDHQRRGQAGVAVATVPHPGRRGSPSLPEGSAMSGFVTTSPWELSPSLTADGTRPPRHSAAACRAHVYTGTVRSGSRSHMPDSARGCR